MKPINELNKDLQQIFRRERLKLITDAEYKKMEVYEELWIEEIYAERTNRDEQVCCIKFSLGDTMVLYRSIKSDGTFHTENETFHSYFNGDESRALKEWIHELEVEKQLMAPS